MFWIIVVCSDFLLNFVRIAFLSQNFANVSSRVICESQIAVCAFLVIKPDLFATPATPRSNAKLFFLCSSGRNGSIRSSISISCSSNWLLNGSFCGVYVFRIRCNLFIKLNNGLEDLSGDFRCGMIIDILVKELIFIGAKQTAFQMECLSILLTRVASMYKDFILVESRLNLEYPLTQWSLLDLFKLF